MTLGTEIKPLPRDRRLLNQIAERLAESPLFSDLQWAEVATITSFMAGFRAPAGAVVFAEGDQAHALCFLIDGAVEINKLDQDGVYKRVAKIIPGRSFGEMSVIDGEPRSATCVAVAGSTIALLSREDFDLLLTKYPALGAKLIIRIARTLSQRLRMASGQLVDYLAC
jgi:CRP-like cAMP-binding protein